MRTPEPKQRLEDLRELAVQIERLYGNRETVRSPAGKAAILRDIRARKRERRERVRALYDDEGVPPSVIVAAAGLTRSAVRRPTT
jgi:hypothetical protein